MVNSQAGKDAQGRLKCPTCGKSSPPGFKAATGKVFKKLSGDHVVPAEKIMQKKGFACLSEANQKKVLNNPKNFVGICPPCNFSKQDKKWKDWNGRNPHGLTKAGKEFAAKQEELSKSLSKNLNSQINRLWS